jgi:hypothetical protein
MEYTHEDLATLALSKKATFDIALKNIQRDPEKMAVASFSSGVYGRRWRVAIEKIMKYHRISIDLSNKDCTYIGMHILGKLEKLGYSFKNDYTEFTKI